MAMDNTMHCDFNLKKKRKKEGYSKIQKNMDGERKRTEKKL